MPFPRFSAAFCADGAQHSKMRDATWERDFFACAFRAGIAEGRNAAPPRLEFANVAWPLISFFTKDVQQGIRLLVEAKIATEEGAGTILNRLISGLYQSVFAATSRALVFELAAAQSTGLLIEKTPQEQYNFFVSGLEDPGFCEEILGQYPVLQKQLLIISDNWRNSSVELFSRLVSDWAAIQDGFFSDSPSGQLTDILYGAGDSHKCGRTTSILHFANDAKLVYKPRPLAADISFQGLARWINSRLGKRSIIVPATLNRGKYGWSAFVTYKSVSSTNELTLYYERFGAIMAVAYLTGLSDLHSENVIAHGPWPVLVDLETLFRPVRDAGGIDGGARESGRIVDQSVLATHLVGAHFITEVDGGAWADLGGVADLAGQTTPFPVPAWEDIGSVEMRLVYERRPLEGAQNIPVLDGARSRPERFMDDVVRGFSEVYRVLEKNKTALQARRGPLEAFRGVPVRVVLRATVLYAQLLRDGFHPDFLQDAESKDAYFNTLLEAESPASLPHSVREAERFDMWNNDVPYFWTRPGVTELRTTTNEPLADVVIEVSGLDAAYQRLDALGPADLDRQCWIIRATLSHADVPHRAPPLMLAKSAITDATDNLARDIVSAVAEKLRAEALANSNTGRTSWLTLTELLGGRLTVSNAGLDLYAGLPGIALFLSYASGVLDDSSLRILAKGTVLEILSRLDAGERNALPVGGFNGRGGLAYTLQQMAPIFPELALTRHAIELIATSGLESSELDVISGLSGLLQASITVLSALRNQADIDSKAVNRVLQQSIAIGERIVHLYQDDNVRRAKLDNGFAHGKAGVAFSLARLWSETNDEQVRLVVQSLLSKITAEMISLEPKHAPLGMDGAHGHPISWCRGITGMAVAFWGAHALSAEPAALTASLWQQLAGARPTDHSLCHGSAGVMMFLNTAVAAGETEARQLQERTAQRVIRSMATGGLVCGTINSISSPGLMEGLAGIGLGALSFLHPTLVPRVLSLEGPICPSLGFRKTVRD